MGKDRTEIKKETIQNIKENGELVKFIQSLTQEEIQRLKDMRTFDNLKPNTNRYKVALLCDPLRQQLLMAKSKLEKRLNVIAELENTMKRLKLQIVLKQITEKLKDGITMTEPEVESLIKHNLWLQKGEVNATRLILSELSGLVGHLDYLKKIIFSEEDFNKIVEETNNSLAKFNYSLFGELE